MRARTRVRLRCMLARVTDASACIIPAPLPLLPRCRRTAQLQDIGTLLRCRACRGDAAAGGAVPRGLAPAPPRRRARARRHRRAAAAHRAGDAACRARRQNQARAALCAAAHARMRPLTLPSSGCRSAEFRAAAAVRAAAFYSYPPGRSAFAAQAHQRMKARSANIATHANALLCRLTTPLPPGGRRVGGAGGKNLRP